MTKKMKPYKGYTATVEFDPDEMVLHGRVDNIRDVVTFHASSVNELQREFAEAIDDYVALCAERKEEPEKPYSGRFVLRIDPSLHRQIAIAAGRSAVSINSWIVDALRAFLDSESAAAEQEEALIERVTSSVRSLLAQQPPLNRRGAEPGASTYVVREASRPTPSASNDFHEQLRKLGDLTWTETPDRMPSRKEELQ